jgi:predicted RNA-binding Zn ribbon-like protein
MEAARRLMFRVTWEWIGFEEALDVANTIAIVDGVEQDLLVDTGAFERWAEAARKSPALTPAEASALLGARERLLDLREPIRALMAATVSDEPPPAAAVVELNRISRRAPLWVEYAEGVLQERTDATPIDRLLARYARSALELAAGHATRRCPAPSCGMFYVPRRRQQRWCSQSCGNRARFARHYKAHRAA